MVAVAQNDVGMAPSPAVDSGRGTGGRFTVGNRCGVGNPHAKRVGELRSALLSAVTPDDMRQIVAKLVEMAKGGDTAAIKLLFDRVLGRAADPAVLDLAHQKDREHTLAERRADLEEDKRTDRLFQD